MLGYQTQINFAQNDTFNEKKLIENVFNQTKRTVRFFKQRQDTRKGRFRYPPPIIEEPPKQSLYTPTIPDIAPSISKPEEIVKFEEETETTSVMNSCFPI